MKSKNLSDGGAGAARARAREEIGSKVKAILSGDAAKLNLLLEVEAAAEEPADADLLKAPSCLASATAAVKGLTTVWVSLIKDGKADVEEDKEEKNASEKASKLKAWMAERLDTAQKIFLTLAPSEWDAGLSDLAVAGYFRLLRARHDRQREVKGRDQPTTDWSFSERRRLRDALTALLDTKRCCTRQIKRLKSFTDKHDVKDHAIRVMAKMIKQVMNDVFYFV